MQIKTVTATNFLSFKELDYNFETKPILIQGENLTQDSQESNGSGKSSLQSAVEYCIFKTTIKETDSDLVFWGEKESLVTLVIDCQIRKETIKIERKIKAKGHGESQLSINGTIKYAFEDKMVAEIDKFIIEWIGITKEDLRNYFIISKERYKSFFTSSNREKIEMINRFSNAKLIDGVGKEVEIEVERLEGGLFNLKSNKTSSLSKIKTLKEQIDIELNRDLQKETKEEIEKFNGHIEAINKEIEESDATICDELDIFQPQTQKAIKVSEATILEKSKVISQVQESLSKLKEISFEDKYSSINKKLSKIQLKQGEIRKKKSKLVSDKNDVEAVLDEIAKNIVGAVKCPKCSHEFLVGDPDVDIEEEKKAEVEISKVLEETQKSIAKILLDLQKLGEQEEEIDEEKSVVKKEEDEITKKRRILRNQIEGIEDEIKILKQSIDKNNNLKLLSNQKIERQKSNIESNKLRIKALKEKIKESKGKKIDQTRIDSTWTQMREEGKKLRQINYDIKSKKDEIFNVSQWIYNFSKFNMYLANQSLKVIQGYCNKFLQDIKTDLQIKWEGMKLLASGKLKEEITSYIIRDNQELKFWSFSGGERVKLEYSLILTLQQMINKTHKYGGLDFISLDEIGEGIDSLGLSDLMKSFEGVQKTILITTHVLNRNIGDNILLIRKIDGVSIIVKN